MELDLRLGEVVRTISVKVSSICLTVVTSVVLALGVQALSGPAVSHVYAQTVAATVADGGEDGLPATPEDDQWT